MRKSFNEIGWVEDEQHTILGLALGFDFCAEHEAGAARLAREFKIPTKGMGFTRLCAQAVPGRVEFEEWTIRPPRARSPRAVAPGAPGTPKAEAAPRPAEKMAALYIGPTRSYGEPLTPRAMAKRELGMVDITSRWYEADRHDIAASWDESEALVQVRGEKNIARLRDLYEAIQTKDLVFNAPVQSGFTRRGGLSLGIASRFDQAFRDSVLAADEAAARLEHAVVQSGIREVLKAAGIGYYALSPSWANAHKEEGLKFFLNPQDQRNNNFGWFTLAELQDWAAGKGPIPKDHALIEKIELFTKERDQNPDFLFVDAACRAGWTVGSARMCWSDEARTRLGVSVRADSDASPTALPAGVYDLEDFLAAAPVPTARPKEILASESVAPPAPKMKR